MPIHPRAILWDVGGTLVDFACTLPENVRSRLTAFGVDHSSLSDDHIESTYADFIRHEPQWLSLEQERTAEHGWFKALLHSQSVDDLVLAELARRMPLYFEWFRPVPGIIELLEELRAQYIRMAIISNWPPSLPGVLEHHCLRIFFDPIVYSGEDGIAKPDQRIFERALRALGVDARHAIFIGDSIVHDIEPAQRIGMQTIHFNPRRNCHRWDANDVTTLRMLLSRMLRDDQI